MKIKRILSLILALTVILSLTTVTAFAKKVDADYVAELAEAFLPGEGPETEGYTIDYRYFSPANEGDTAKYPLVIWLHGMGDGSEEGKQVKKSDIARWSSPDFQSRFGDVGGAYILAPRSPEEDGVFWPDALIYPLRATVDAFIAENRDNIDVSRIYIGGYSMGGKMTLKMAVAYPEMFAAAFPICPAWTPDEAQSELIADMPIWLTSGKLDPLVNYYMSVKPAWEALTSVSHVAEDCRFSSLSRTAYPDGMPTTSSHHSWFAVNNDMFTYDGEAYPAMKTVNGLGEEVTLTYPDGMISWLSSHSSGFDGTVATNKGNDEAYSSGADRDIFEIFTDFLKDIVSFFKSLFAGCE